MRIISDFGFRISDFLKFAPVKRVLYRTIRNSQFAIFLLLLCSCSQVFLHVRAPKTRYAVKRLAILPFAATFETAEPHPSLRRPLNLGISQNEAEDPIGVKKIPARVGEKKENWFGGYARVQLLVGKSRAQSVAREITSMCYEKISAGDFKNLMGPDRASASMTKREREKAEEGGLTRKDLMRLGRALGVGTILVGNITRYETDVTRHSYKAHERFASKDAPFEETTSLKYIHRCEMRISLFDVASSTFVWTAVAQANYDNITGDFAHDFALAASGRGRWGDFLNSHLLSKITQDTPLKKCLSGILSRMPR